MAEWTEQAMKQRAQTRAKERRELDKRVYILITCEPGLYSVDVAKIVGVSVRRVKSSLCRLEKKGFLMSDLYPSLKSGNGQRRFWRVPVPW